MRITEAAHRLGTSARMLRYREALGLLPPTKDEGGKHRQFDETELAAVSLALDLERHYDVSPAALAFALRVLAEPEVRANVRELGERTGRLRPAPTRALDFEKEKALALLRTETPRSRRPRRGTAPG